MQVPIGMIQRITSPHPFALVSSLKDDGSTNLMAISWWSFASNQPASLIVCLSQKGYSGKCIEKTGQFSLNIVNETLKESAFRCGTCSGATMDKAATFNIALTPARQIQPMLVKDSIVSLECLVTEKMLVGDHILFAAVIEDAHIRESETPHLYTFDGYARLGTI